MNTSQRLLLCIGIFILGISCDRPGNKVTSKNGIGKFLEKGEDTSLADSLRVTYLDSAYSDLSKNKNDSVTRDLYAKVATAYYNISKYDRSISASKKTHTLASEVHDSIRMAKSLYLSGISYYEKGITDSAFASYRQAEKIYTVLNNPNLGEIILYKAYIYYDIGDYVMCEGEAFKALRLLQEQKWNTEIYNCYNLIANSLDGQDSSVDAIKYFKLALNQLDSFKDEGYTEETINAFKTSCYNNMGGVYVKMKLYDTAIERYNEALAYGNIKTTNPLLYAKLLHGLAAAKLKKGDTREVLKLFAQSLKIKDSLGNKMASIASKIGIGEYYIVKKDTQRAINYLEQAYRDADRIHNSINVLNSVKLLTDLDKVNSNFYSDKYIHVSDSLQTVAKLNRNKFARIEYETDQIQGEKEALARKNSFIIGISVVVLLFVAAIFIIYYLNSRNKELLHIQEQQKANEEIYQLMFEQQGKIDSARADEKTRIAMELHDGILNNIYAVRLNLEFSNRKTDAEAIEKRKSYIKELQSVETEIRAVSHDLSKNVIFDQNKNFENILAFMVTSQKNNFHTQFEAIIDAAIDWENMPNTVKVNIYRIIQEALQNINKYSQAHFARVAVKREDDAIKISVTDDGVGFDTAVAAAGIGHKNLKKRTESLNGTLQIDSEPGKGSAITVHFPL